MFCIKNQTPKMILPYCCRLLNNMNKLCQRSFMSCQQLSSMIKHGYQIMQPLQITQTRWFWSLSVAFNQVDKDRVRLAGPDRAAAEWVLRNGGSIKWKNAPFPLEDYNMLPSTNFEDYKVEEIDLRATDVIGLGFQHLENLRHVKSVKLHGCRLIMDDALENLHFVKDTLEWLQISRCPMITDKGLQTLQILKSLKTLVIYDLIEINNFEESISRLGQIMPWCQILSDDPLVATPETDGSDKNQ